MAKFKYIPLSAVIARVIELAGPERTNERTLYNWAADGMKDVYVADTLADFVCFVRVENFSAKLPKSWVSLQQIMYSDASMNQEAPLTVYLSSMNLVQDKDATVNKAFNIEFTDRTEEPTPEQIATTDFYASLSNQPLLGQPQGTYVNKLHYDFVQRPLQETNGRWRPLRQSTSRFHKTIPCGLDISYEACKQTFSYDPTCNKLVISFEKGWLCISYKGYPQCDEDFKIPDFDSGVPQAIEAYLLYKVFEKETIKGVDGSRSLRDDYHRKFELLTAKAKGNQRMPDNDQLENFRTSLTRLTQHNNTYNTGFGNAADFESLILR